MEEARFATPSLTAVDSGLAWVATRAVELLLSRIEGHVDGPIVEIAEHHVIARSTA